METTRRALDIALSAAGLVLLSPVFLLCALAVRWNSPGPIIYRQARVGLNGALFRILKFRSMVDNADEVELLVTGEEDFRVTRVGRWLRRFKLDELPQLVNVLRGEMSMVGPRPRVEKYARHYPEELRATLLSVRPGITDTATIRAVQQERVLGKVEVSNREDFYLKRILPGELRRNVEDIRDRSLRSYFRILVLTVFVLLGGEGLEGGGPPSKSSP